MIRRFRIRRAYRAIEAADRAYTAALRLEVM